MEGPRNTGPPRTPARRWFITAFFQQWHVPSDLGEPYRYIRGQREICPTTGRKHYHLYVETSRPVRYTAVQRQLELGSCNIYIARGTPGECIVYVTKRDTRDIDDHQITWPEGAGDEAPGGQGRRTDLEAVRTGITTAFRAGGERSAWDWLYANDFPTALRYDNGISKYLRHISARTRTDAPQVSIYEGATGTGKTRAVWTTFPDVFALPPVEGNRIWFDGYMGQKAALIDDFDGYAIPITFMLRLLDRYPMKVQVKGGFVDWCPEYIVITTNLPFNRWYEDADTEHRAALQRRIQLYRIFERDRPPRLLERRLWQIPDI